MDQPIILLEYGAGIIYLILLAFTIIRILLDTESSAKTLAYLMLVIILPVVGILIYFSFGVNYRHRQITKEGEESFKQINSQYNKVIKNNVEEVLTGSDYKFHQYDELARYVNRLSGGEILGKNNLTLLINGEKKFPKVLEMLDKAERFIHMEYYDWENDTRGNQIKDVLLKKHKEGVKVRIMYDDFASQAIKKNIVKELKSAGIEIHPVIKVTFKRIANRLNHRDHRKVIIIDGHTGFVGGINVSDRYDNSIDTGLYWRDTHAMIQGPSVLGLLKHWIVNWNTSQSEQLSFGKDLVPDMDQILSADNGKVYSQIVAGGPVYKMSNIMLTYSRIFTLAREKLYITNPYFIPSETIINSMKEAAISGVDVRLLVPQKSDSGVVGAASKFYYSDLLEAGVRVFEYKPGFIHAKTVVADTFLSVVGTANMDIRSFDLNFEIFSVTYNNEFATQLENAYLDDLKESDEVLLEDWKKQSTAKMLVYALARLSSSFL